MGGCGRGAGTVPPLPRVPPHLRKPPLPLSPRSPRQNGNPRPCTTSSRDTARVSTTYSRCRPRPVAPSASTIAVGSTHDHVVPLQPLHRRRRQHRDPPSAHRHSRSIQHLHAPRPPRASAATTPTDPSPASAPGAPRPPPHPARSSRPTATHSTPRRRAGIGPVGTGDVQAGEQPVGEGDDRLRPPGNQTVSGIDRGVGFAQVGPARATPSRAAHGVVPWARSPRTVTEP